MRSALGSKQSVHLFICITESYYRVIAISDVVFLRSDEGDKAFEDAWTSLVEERELVCKQTGTRFTAFPKPEAMILDVRALASYIVYLGLMQLWRCSSLLVTRTNSLGPSAGKP